MTISDTAIGYDLVLYSWVKALLVFGLIYITWRQITDDDMSTSIALSLYDELMSPSNVPVSNIMYI